MTMYEIIMKKRSGRELSEAEIRWFIQGVTDGSIPDYQTSALMMAIYFQGMNERETDYLTDAMMRSGDVVDLKNISGIKVDKHSTGGVGDKTTLALGPILAACGLKVAKMSGRGLGHTGGTLDKIESIPGCTTQIDPERFVEIVNESGLCVVGQSGNLAPADKKLYALRDVTATVDNLSLIASSIMSKKLAAGADVILLDVKYGSGAFMKTPEDACALAQAMVKIGNNAGRSTAALITSMDRPLGCAVGNSLEVTEAAETLRGKGPEDFEEVCLSLAEKIMVLAKMGEAEECRKKAKQTINDGTALRKLMEMVRAQGGDDRYIEDPSLFAKSSIIKEIYAPEEGYLSHMDAEAVGRASVFLGAGRETKDSLIDYSAGILLRKKTGDYVKKGEPLAKFFTEREEAVAAAEEIFLKGMEFSAKQPQLPPLIYGYVDEAGVHLC